MRSHFLLLYSLKKNPENIKSQNTQGYIAKHSPERSQLNYFSCGVIWRGEESSQSAVTISYIIFIYLLGFICPLVIISTSYLKIIKTIRKVTTKIFCIINNCIKIESETIRNHKVKLKSQQGQETHNTCGCYGKLPSFLS